MNITSRQRQLVRETFDLVKPHAAVAALLFYRRLFTLDPSLRGLFHNDIEAQGQKLMQALEFAVAGLDRPEATTPMLESLGRRHLTYGVRDEHYDTVGAALLWTLEQDLGPAFTTEAKEAWATVYTFLATTMRNAAREISPALAAR